MSRVFSNAAAFPNNLYINTPSSSVYNNLSKFTVAAWIYPTTANVGVIGAKDPSGAFSPGIVADGGPLFGQVVSTLGGLDGAISAATANLSLNVWSHVAMTFDFNGDKKIRLYTNGVETPYTIQRAFSAGAQKDDSGNGWLFGDILTGGLGFDGAIAEFAEWNTVLTSPQLIALAGSTTGASAISPSNLVGYWHLMGATSPEPDSSGGGNSGVLSANPPGQAGNSPGYTPGTSGSIGLGSFHGTSLATAFTNLNNLDLIQVVNEGGNVVWNLSAIGNATFNPKVFTPQALLGKFEGQTFAQAFPNPLNQDIFQVIGNGGSIVYSVDYQGAAS